MRLCPIGSIPLIGLGRIPNSVSRHPFPGKLAKGRTGLNSTSSPEHFALKSLGKNKFDMEEKWNGERLARTVELLERAEQIRERDHKQLVYELIRINREIFWGTIALSVLLLLVLWSLRH